MRRFDASVGLRKRHAAGRPLVLQRREACAPVAHAATTRCSGDAGQNLFRLSWSGWTTWRQTTPRPSICFSEYIELSRNGKHLFGFLSSFIHMRSTAMRIGSKTRGSRHRPDAGRRTDAEIPHNQAVERAPQPAREPRTRLRRRPVHGWPAFRSHGRSESVPVSRTANCAGANNRHKNKRDAAPITTPAIA